MKKEFRVPRKNWRNIKRKLSALQIYQHGTLEFFLPIRFSLCEVGGQNEACPSCRLRTGGHATALPTLHSAVMGILLNLRS
ncbi:MAG: hypothetical protein Q8R24_04895, partial [Legionellaceae bacterium]|nr:hypothetical protein [Legionellaceae bacterium]